MTAGGCNLCPRAGPLCGSLLHPRRTLAIICTCLVLSCSLPLVISCGDPGTLPNGIQFGTDFTFNKTVSYQCNPGYLMEPPISPTIRCTKDGTWNQSRPVCKGECHRLPGIVGLEVHTGQCCISFCAQEAPSSQESQEFFSAYVNMDSLYFPDSLVTVLQMGN